ncbi:MAG: septum formation protein Maf [Bacteroidales bacterium]|nr:septum formation protein Maf [Bacteroidales bacterium]
MLTEKIKDYNILLGSQSPRRKELLAMLNINFQVRLGDDFDEVFPDDMDVNDVPLFLSRGKSHNIPLVNSNDLLITSDTIVVLDDNVLGKPADYYDAFNMLKALSGRSHKVITGVYFRTNNKEIGFCSTTQVFFKNLSDSEIEFYINNYKPYDKAGSYGIQEWIGAIGVERIEGSYFNVMGLPVQQLYTELLKFIN